MSWNPLFACLITSDCLPETQPARPSPARFESSVPNELHNSGDGRASPHRQMRSALHRNRCAPKPPPLLWLLWCVFLWLLWCRFRRRASKVTMVHISLVTMVRVSTHTRRQPANHASTHPKITMVMNKGTMVSIYRGERTYLTTTNRGTTHTPSVAMVRITPPHTRPAHKPPAYTSNSKRALHPKIGIGSCCKPIYVVWVTTTTTPQQLEKHKLHTKGHKLATQGHKVVLVKSCEKLYRNNFSPQFSPQFSPCFFLRCK